VSMKFLAIVFSLVFAIIVEQPDARAANPTVEHDYQELKDAILSGRNVGMTFDLAACHVHGTDSPGPNIRGGLHFEGFMVEPDETIAFSTTHFTVKADNTPMNEVLSFRVQPSGAMSARTRFVNAKTYEVVRDMEFDCSIGKGVAFHW
jgi:hypothetical protein